MRNVIRLRDVGFSVVLVLALGVMGVLAADSSSPRASASSPLSGEQINWHLMTCGGGYGRSINYGVNATAGQMAAGTGLSTNFGVQSGFWPSPPTSCCTSPTRGDVDASGSVDISDLSIYVDYLFYGIRFPANCFQEEDVDASGAIDISDLQILIDFLFSGVHLPPCP